MSKEHTAIIRWRKQLHPKTDIIIKREIDAFALTLDERILQEMPQDSSNLFLIRYEFCVESWSTLELEELKRDQGGVKFYIDQYSNLYRKSGEGPSSTYVNINN